MALSRSHVQQLSIALLDQAVLAYALLVIITGSLIIIAVYAQQAPIPPQSMPPTVSRAHKAHIVPLEAHRQCHAQLDITVPIAVSI